MRGSVKSPTNQSLSFLILHFLDSELKVVIPDLIRNPDKLISLMIYGHEPRITPSSAPVSRGEPRFAVLASIIIPQSLLIS